MDAPRTLLLAADPVLAWRAHREVAPAGDGFDLVWLASPAARASFGVTGPATTLERWARRPPLVVAPPLERRRALIDAVADALGGAGDDAAGHAAVGAEAVRDLLRAAAGPGAGPDLDDAPPAALGARGVRWWRVAAAYRARLRASGACDPAEVRRLAAARAEADGAGARRLAVLGHATLQPDEVGLIDAVAGPGSLVVLPHDPPWTEANGDAVRELVARGWQVAYDDRAAPSAARLALAWPTAEDEARGALAEVKRLRAGGVSAGDVVLLARDPQRVAEAVHAAAHETGVAVRVDRWVPLAATPAAGALVAWLEAVARNGAFEATLAWLAHPAVARLGADDVARVRLWRPSDPRAWGRASVARDAVSQADGAPAGPTKADPGSSDRDRVRAALEWPRAATPAAWRARLRDGWGDLGGAPAAPAPLDDAAVRAAWDAALAGLDDLAPDGATLPRGRVLGALRDALRHTSVRWTHPTAAPSDPALAAPDDAAGGAAAGALGDAADAAGDDAADAVWLRPLEAAGDLRVPHVLLLGAVDGLLPTAVADDPALGFRERAALRAAGWPLATAGTAGRLEALRFWGALRAATVRAWIGVPAQTGADARLPSPYLARLGLAVRTPEASPPASPQAFRARALRAPEAVPDVVDAVLARARRAHAQALARETGDAWGPDDGFVGIGVDPDARTWSATQLRDLGTCRFRWWASRVWGVAAPEEGPEELTPLLEGRLYHEALDRALEAAVGKRGAAARAAALAALDAAFAAAEALDRLADVVPHWARLRGELLAHLRGLIEAPEFLPDDHEVVRTEGSFAGSWHGWRVRGRVDRVDRTPAGVELIDYKLSGRKPVGARDAELKPTLDLQLPLYRDVAAPQLAPGEPVVGAVYVSLRTRARVPATPPDPGHLADLLARLRASLRAGFFPPEPDPAVCFFCDLEPVCRKGPHLERRPPPYRVPGASPEESR